MKSKIIKIKPTELSTMLFKDIKILLKKDLALLAEQPGQAPFFIATEFKYADSDKPILVVGTPKGEWKKYLKDIVKPPNKHAVTGTCRLSDDQTTLTLCIAAGKAKPMVIKKVLKKNKLLPPSIKVVEFVEAIEPKSTDTSTDQDPSTATIPEDTLYPQIVAQIKKYKELDKTTAVSSRLDFSKQLFDIINTWEQKYNPYLADSDVAKKNIALQAFKNQLTVQTTNVQIANRTNIEDITPILTLWEDYKQLPTQASGIDTLPLVEKRVEQIAPVKSGIVAWFKRNFGKKNKEERQNEKKLEKIQKQIEQHEPVLQQQLVAARKKYAKDLINHLKGLTPAQRQQTANNAQFMADVHRYVSVNNINAIRQYLGLNPIDTVDPLAASPETKAAWDDPEIQAMFTSLNTGNGTPEQPQSFNGFEDNVTVHYRQNPQITTTITLPANAPFYTANGDRQILSAPYTFDVVSEDANGRLQVEGGGITYYVDKGVGQMNGYEKTTDPLFPQDPSPKDVKQGSTGDCYLMAIMASLADSDPQFIKDMMKDKGSTVVVRLFHVTADRSGNKSFEARYFEIEKSVPKDGNGDAMFAKESLWVQMLEKAYAAGGFTGMFKDYIGNLNNQDTSYDTIGQGGWGFAMEVLTGRPSADLFFQPPNHSDYIVTDLTNIKRGTTQASSQLQGVYPPWSTNERNMFATARNQRDYARLNAYAILGNDLQKVQQWFQFVNAGTLAQLFAKEHNAQYSGQLTIDDFVDLFNGKMKDTSGNETTGLTVLDSTIAQMIIDWITAQKLYPGKRGSGIYSILQLNLFQEIKTALDKNELVTFGSKKKLGQLDGSGHSAGEGLSGGLVGPHMYSVHECTEANAPSKEFLIRNPWGRYEQENVRNEQGELVARVNTGSRPEDNDGEFWLLLDDLTKSFNGICIG